MSYTKTQDLVLFFLRLVIAVIFLYAAYGKLFFWSAPPSGMPGGMILLMKFLSIAEALGGLAVLIGFLTRWAARGLFVIMVGAILFLQFMMQTGFATATGTGWNFPLMILAGCAILMAFGPGSWSLDEKQKRK